MEVLDQPVSKRNQLQFFGQGGTYFGIWIVNVLLTMVTFGLYYPWSRAATLKYFYQETELDGSRFQFHGTGKEMFLGFIKAIGIILVLQALFMGSVFSGHPVLGILIFLIAIIFLVPFAIHGTMKYRASRSSYRGVHFGYRGELSELMKICFVGGFLSIITFGIYSFWLVCDIRKYLFQHLRFGNIEFDYRGRGGENFGINLAGYLLTIITIGIYSFWWMKDRFNFYVNNVAAEQDGRLLQLRSTATGGDFFSLMIVNFLLIIFTLGLATPLVAVRTIDFAMRHIEILGDFRPSDIRQTEAEYRDATGDDMSDMMDIGLV